MSLEARLSQSFLFHFLFKESLFFADGLLFAEGEFKGAVGISRISAVEARLWKFNIFMNMKPSAYSAIMKYWRYRKYSNWPSFQIFIFPIRQAISNRTHTFD